MAASNEFGVLHLKTDSEVINFVADYARGERTVNGSGVDIAIIDTLTPELAQYFLDTGLRNRNPDGRHVGLLASIMQAGDFVGGLDPVRLDRWGRAIDFMHRGLGVVTSKSEIKGVPVFVLADDKAMTALDTDAKARNLRNVYDIRGDKAIPNCVVAGAIFELCDFKAGRAGVQAKDGFLQVYDQLDIMLHLYKVNSKVTGGLLAAAARCSRVDARKAKTFFTNAVMRSDKFDQLPLGDDIKPLEISTLRKKLGHHIRDRVRGDMRLKRDAAAGLYCFDAWYSGRRSGNFSCPRETLSETDKKKGRTMGEYKIIDIGREQFRRSPVSKLMEEYNAVRKSADQVVRAYNQKKKKN